MKLIFFFEIYQINNIENIVTKKNKNNFVNLFYNFYLNHDLFVKNFFCYKTFITNFYQIYSIIILFNNFIINNKTSSNYNQLVKIFFNNKTKSSLYKILFLHIFFNRFNIN